MRVKSSQERELRGRGCTRSLRGVGKSSGMASELAGWSHTRARGVREAGTWGRRPAYLFTTQLPWTSIATFWTPRRTATESVEGPRRLIKLAKGMTFTEEGGRGPSARGRPGLPVPPRVPPGPQGCRLADQPRVWAAGRARSVPPESWRTYPLRRPGA